MIIFPAVDLQQGKAVRLKQGKRDESTVFSHDPVAMARQWVEQGAKYLHLVDLDGAFDGTNEANEKLVMEICQEIKIPVQLGGGIRSQECAQRWFDAGVSRLIIGTVALEEPQLFASMCAKFPGMVGVSLDADNGLLKTRGWVQSTGKQVSDVLPQLLAAGAAFVIYTDISRDGMQSGVNLSALESLACQSLVPVLVAGGVATLCDVQQVYALGKNLPIEGIISGRAIYEGTLNLQEAQAWLDLQNAPQQSAL